MKEDEVDYTQYRYKKFLWHEKGRENLPIKRRAKFVEKPFAPVSEPPQKKARKRKIKAPRRTDGMKPDGQGVFVVVTLTVCFLLTFFLAEFFGGDGAAKLFKKNDTKLLAEYFAVTVGTYDDESASAALAQEIRNMGAAGFMVRDGGFRIIASVYKTRAEAETIVGRMDGYSPSIYAISVGVPALNWCKTSDKAAVESSLNYAENVFDGLYKISVDLDKSNISTSQAISRIKTLYTQIIKSTAVLDNLSINRDTIELVRLKAEITAVTAMLKNLTESDLSQYALLADIRYTAAAVVWGCKNLTVNI